MGFWRFEVKKSLPCGRAGYPRRNLILTADSLSILPLKGKSQAFFAGKMRFLGLGGLREHGTHGTTA